VIRELCSEPAAGSQHRGNRYDPPPGSADARARGRATARRLELDANDLVNILESVAIPVIIVDRFLRVRRFTPTARTLLSLIPGDVGRPIDDVKLKVRVDNLVEKIKETIETITPREWEVQALDGRWFRLQIRPYRTVDNRIDGAILSFVDYARGIVETVPISLVVLAHARDMDIGRD
jgi:two-component system CheB/CheR fusion protein